MMNVSTIRAVVRAKFVKPDITVREQAAFAGASPSATHRLNKRCQKLKIDHLLLEQLSNKEVVEVLLYSDHRTSCKREPDYNEALRELSKARGKRKSRTVLYLEYRAIDPATAMSKTHYFRMLNKVMKRVKVVMKQHHVAGENMYIDYAGTKVFYKVGGEKVWVKIFVATLGASKKLFAFATEGEKTVHWIDGMTKAVTYFAGCTETVTMDNAKALVSEPGLVANLVDNVMFWAEHYGCLINTCRVGHPQDKSLVENGVKFITQRVLVPMLNMTFFDINEINQYILKEVEKLNNECFQGFDISRNDLFEENERGALRPCPATPYRMVTDRQVKRVKPDYHFEYGNHDYSVPYTLAGESVDIVVTQNEIGIYHQNRFVYKHHLSKNKGGSTTIPEHMSAEHLADFSMCDKKANIKWAEDTGEQVQAIVESWYSQTKNPQSRPIAKRCRALMNLVQKQGSNLVNQACEYALRHDMDKPSEIELIISAQKAEGGFENLPSRVELHGNIRGRDYYGDNYDA
ncbi:IS21 family transposase [Idiomarina aquatica]|uniref:Integrase catalytic domain-containing protein n=1 Tax=Idiomarina aquatica TaxID=1327752 RepID=A0AA94EIA2_9GAMM|nr:IS21 family transposase [Idiomarina aquatica]RUO45614.1 hypothetical protein CWE23_06390 [Idiomarina aquatica]